MSAGRAGLGVVGGILHDVLFNSQVKRGKVSIAPVGIVEVMEVEYEQSKSRKALGTPLNPLFLGE